MRVPISWLREFVDVGVSVAEVAALAERLTFAGFEVEAIEGIGAYDPRVVAGAVRENREVPGKPVRHLRLDVGQGSPIELVTGAPNMREVALGTKVVVALPGAQIFDAKLPRPKARTVTAATLYGVASQGVLCSDKEIGVGEDHSGVRLLPESARPGQPVAEILAPDARWTADQVLTLAVLPNAARTQSVLGVAREVAALTNRPLRETLTLAETEVRSAGRKVRGPVKCRVCDRTLTEAVERKLRRCESCPSSMDEALYDRLRGWRMAQAREQGVPAYVVFTDATLMAIAEDTPRTPRELALIPGVGAMKLDKYGAAVLSLCAGEPPVDETTDPADEVADVSPFADDTPVDVPGEFDEPA